MAGAYGPHCYTLRSRLPDELQRGLLIMRPVELSGGEFHTAGPVLPFFHGNTIEKDVEYMKTKRPKYFYFGLLFRQASIRDRQNQLPTFSHCPCPVPCGALGVGCAASLYRKKSVSTVRR